MLQHTKLYLVQRNFNVKIPQHNKLYLVQRNFNVKVLLKYKKMQYDTAQLKIILFFFLYCILNSTTAFNIKAQPNVLTVTVLCIPLGCHYRGQTYEHEVKWFPIPDNNCLECTCVDGEVRCGFIKNCDKFGEYIVLACPGLKRLLFKREFFLLVIKKRGGGGEGEEGRLLQNFE